jgi:predicted PurR-regulated permease PerM
MKLEKVAYRFIIIGLVLAFIYYSKAFLVPLILAIVLWYLINALNQAIRTITPKKFTLPKALTLGLSTILILFVIFVASRLVAQNVNGMINAAPDYRVNIESQMARILNAVGYSQSFNIQDISSELNLSDYLRRLLNSFRTIAQQFLLILLYTLFLLLEQSTFPRKILALGWQKERRENISKVVVNINQSVRTYIGVKFLASLATGFFSYLVIKFAGLDFALFWAFLIFVFNFIPTVGSIVATLFPSFIALIQFETLTPFLLIIIGVGVIQLLIGGIMEPRLYGNSLNISPFVIVLALVSWGLLWGVVGMLLCVPITVIFIQVFAQFENTKAIAILLSRNGRIH